MLSELLPGVAESALLSVLVILGRGYYREISGHLHHHEGVLLLAHASVSALLVAHPRAHLVLPGCRSCVLHRLAGACIRTEKGKKATGKQPLPLLLNTRASQLEVSVRRAVRYGLLVQNFVRNLTLRSC